MVESPHVVAALDCLVATRLGIDAELSVLDGVAAVAVTTGPRWAKPTSVARSLWQMRTIVATYRHRRVILITPMNPITSALLLALFERASGERASVDAACLDAAIRALGDGEDVHDRAARFLYQMARLRPFPKCNAEVTITAVEWFYGRNGWYLTTGVADQCFCDAEEGRTTLSSVRDALRAGALRVYD